MDEVIPKVNVKFRGNTGKAVHHMVLIYSDVMLCFFFVVSKGGTNRNSISS